MKDNNLTETLTSPSSSEALTVRKLLSDTAFASRSLLAGGMIGLGCMVYVILLPVSKVLGSFLFSLGLISVIIQQLNLFTGKIGYLKASLTDLFRMLLMLIWNFAGIVLMCGLFSLTRLDFGSALTLMPAKMGDSLLSLFVLGIGCGIMMYLAVDNFRKKNHPIYVILPIMFFILCGFEHCIADMGYFALAVFGGYDGWMAGDSLLRIGVIIAGNGVGSIIVNKLSFWGK